MRVRWLVSIVALLGGALRWAHSAEPDPTEARSLAASVRIRVVETRGPRRSAVRCGSGTVIGTTPGRAVVLTCGHLVRKLPPDARVEVDLFAGRRSTSGRRRTASRPGTVLGCDLEADVGLVTVPRESSPPAVRLASEGTSVETGQAVASVGCDGGGRPTLERLRVTAVNRYLGPENVECTGVPKQGRSGGGLFDASGDLIGVCTAADPEEGRGLYAGLTPVRKLLKTSGVFPLDTPAARELQLTQATQPAQRPVDATRRPPVVAFVSSHCRPCLQLKADVAAGKFAGYTFVFVHYDPRIGGWDRPELYRAFWKACRPQRETLAFPTIWVQGSDRYRVGYAAERRGGLLNWLAAVARQLVEGIVGRPPQPAFPRPPAAQQAPDGVRQAPDGARQAPDGVSPPETKPAKPAAADGRSETPGRYERSADSGEASSAIRKLLADVAALREEAQTAKADLERFQASGLLGKAKGIAALKADYAQATARYEALRADVQAVKEQFGGRPLQFLWGLFGLITGCLHRRYA